VMQAHDCICYDDGHTAILMDRMQGSLKGEKQDRTSKDILRQLLNGLAHIHRDTFTEISSRTTFCTSSTGVIPHQDFRLRAREEGFGVHDSGMMTVNYRAPEMTVRKQVHGVRRYMGSSAGTCALFINGPINPKINTDDIWRRVRWTWTLTSRVSSIS
jgi:hypothetical protein